MNNIEKKILSYLTAGVIASTSYICTKICLYSETITKVSNNIRSELYNQGLLDSRLLDINFPYNSEKNDPNITLESLKKSTTLNINMDENENLSFLKKFPNLNTIKINNAELLTDKDIEYINASSVNKVMLEFCELNVEKDRENKFDVSRIKNKKIEIYTDSLSYYSDDLNDLIFINYLQNYDDSMIKSDKIDEARKLDNKLNEIIGNLGIKKDSSDMEKIFIISNYICNKIKYDENIQNSSYEDDKSKNMVHYYNVNNISSIINKNGENVNGICANYSSLFEILCYKLDIKSRKISAYNSNKLGHAWNIVYLKNDQRFYVDLTAFDEYSSLKKFLNSYINDEFNEDYKDYVSEIIKNYLLLNLYDSDYADFHLEFSSIDDLDQKAEKLDIKYYNEELDGEIVYENKNLIPIIVGLGTDFLIFSLVEVLKHKKNKQLTKSIKENK